VFASLRGAGLRLELRGALDIGEAVHRRRSTWTRSSLGSDFGEGQVSTKSWELHYFLRRGRSGFPGLGIRDAARRASILALRSFTRLCVSPLRRPSFSARAYSRSIRASWLFMVRTDGILRFPGGSFGELSIGTDVMS
jgi:hypothetical protein